MFIQENVTWGFRVKQVIVIVVVWIAAACAGIYLREPISDAVTELLEMDRAGPERPLVNR